MDASNSIPSTPDATAGVAQSKDPQTGTARRRVLSYSDDDRPFDISPSLSRHVQVRPYQRRFNDPVYRPLRIFALDPAVSKLDGAVALVNVPYEPLKPGPRGRLFHVKEVEQPKTAGNDEEPECSEWLKRDSVCDLEDHRVLLTQGYAPARSDPRFQNQMIYAVCSSVYAAFKAALGRDPVWGFDRQEDNEELDPGTLTLFPRAFKTRNAHYDKSNGSLNFGYFAAKDTANGFMQGECVFTCLSHDVVVHELTHALLDGMRAHFTIPTQIDVLAFHEAFADLVSVFQHFSYREVVLAAIKKSRGKVTGALLTDLARPLAESAGLSADRPSALRRAIDDPRQPPEKRLRYNQKLEVHELGSVLVLAVFDAFNTVYLRKVERYIRLASGGFGRLGEFPADLQAILAEEASQLASQFLSICIRAIDYCPPVDLEFGDFLRAVITADRELVPDDRWGYREAWIDAFRERGILPLNVEALDEEALSWKAPKEKLNPVKKLSFYWLRFRGDPGRPADENELCRQALALGAVIADPKYTEAFGLLTPQAGSIHKPCIESIRSARRIGPDGQIVFDIVAEISQRRIVSGKSGRGLVFYGGSTVVLGPEGEIRYVIGKGVKSDKRAEIQFDFMQSDRGMRYWELRNNLLEPKQNMLKSLHHFEAVEN
jgi:hypothetical protein